MVLMLKNDVIYLLFGCGNYVISPFVGLPTDVFFPLQRLVISSFMLTFVFLT